MGTICQKRRCKQIDNGPGAVSTSKTNAFAAKGIVGWIAKKDYTIGDEAGVELRDGQYDALAEEFPLPGDKLYGWPHWIQGEEYPNCRKCDATMQHVFQIDSNCGLDYIWGDVGCSHLTQCPHHVGELAFAWACG